MYDELKVAHEEKVWQEIVGAKDAQATLQTRIRELEPRQASQPAGKTARSQRARQLVIGLTLDSYKHDPKLSRSTLPQEIADDLAEHGIVLDVNTVRKWLKQAADLLPGE
ncbi:hypothetical protein [Bradyrhizobium sp. WSM2254]|uniref:hypothetical protein n=1 Tax=Bradyrhizobium sp. WSM2254 TaxID=1188263 RepID=UPI0004075C57|nr:hypothetical protein [Bradyrhizobium sp. WSM2254]